MTARAGGPTQVRAALVRSVGAAPELVELELAPLRHDEVLVRVAATGICHTDVAWASGELFAEFPVVLGHETSGVVEQVGAGVESVSPGDRVVIALTHHCGRCRDCETGSPMNCARRPVMPARLSVDGSTVAQGFGVGGFAEAVVVREMSCVRVPDDVPLTTASVVGCAVATGLGAVFNVARVTTGSRVLVIGGGGIGLCVAMGSALSGAEQLVVVDPVPARRATALSVGATEVVAPDEDALHAMTPDGFDFVFESVGAAACMEQAVRLTRRGGTVTLIGAPPTDATFTVPALDFVVSQRRLLGCHTGNVSPHTDFETYFRLYQRGRLDLDALVTSVLPLEELATGFARNRDAEGVRTVVTTGSAD